MANHLTPTELADITGMQRREVISKCMELGVPIFQGRIDKTLFLTSLKYSQVGSSQSLTPGRRPRSAARTLRAEGSSSA